jgi:hypothetical protein
LLVGIAIQGYQIHLMVQLQRERARKAAHHAPTAAAVAFDASGAAMTRNLEWTPLKGGGANFRTGKLVQRSTTRFEVQATPQVILFCWAFIAMGLVIGGAITFGELQNGSPGSALFPAFFGMVFSAIGAGMLYFFTRPAVFDRQLGWYWKGDTKLRAHHDVRRLKEATELANIQGLQVLAEYCSGSRKTAPYYSYELNLVLKDGRRINVMDHGSRDTLMADADALAKFLGVPVWDKQLP